MQTRIPPRFRKSTSGFSLLEVVVTIAILTTISSIAFYFTTNVFQNTRQAKLTAQVASLNQALRVYQANGGNLGTAVTAQLALDRLKTSSSNGAIIAGLRGSMVDKRLLAIERKTGVGSRAFWNNASKRFGLKQHGKGIFEFSIDERAGAKDYGTEERSANLKLAQKDAWVWDYKDFDRGGHGPGGFPHDPLSRGDDTPDNPDATPGVSYLTRLQPPVFSLPSGIYDESTLATLALSHSNPPESSTLFYSLDSGSTWIEYKGTFDVPSWPTTIVAYVDSRNDKRWIDSDVALETYDLPPPPSIEFYTTVELID